MDLTLQNITNSPIQLFKENFLQTLTPLQKVILAIGIAVILGGIAAFFLYRKWNQSSQIEKTVSPITTEVPKPEITTEATPPSKPEPVADVAASTEEGAETKEAGEKPAADEKPTEPVEPEKKKKIPVKGDVKGDAVDPALQKKLDKLKEEAELKGTKAKEFVKDTTPKKSHSVTKPIPKPPAAPKAPSTPKLDAISPEEKDHQLALKLEAEASGFVGVDEALKASLATVPPVTLVHSKSLGHIKKASTIGDEALLKTSKANEKTASHTLEMAVENAKAIKKLKITKHEILLNDAGNAYLVLHFSKDFYRNQAVEELRSNHGMFATTPTLAHETDTTLKLTVEQTIEFQNKF